MDFALETARPRAGSTALLRGRGRTGSSGLLLERDAEERRDDASSGDERATQRA